jgi:uncharacterized protein YjbI with pentapeptide repeats
VALVLVTIQAALVVVGIGSLIILARQEFPWDALSITALSQDPWYIGAIGIGFVLIVLLVLLWWLPKRKAALLDLGPKEQFDVENETRKTWATIAGGMAVLFSLLFTWANLRVTQDNLRITQEAATKSQELTREGQITDRFTKAIAQLGEQGPEKLAVRLGGTYALERIARESKADHWPIMEILTAYVRVNAPWKSETLLTQNYQAPHKLAVDIQATLTVLGRRTRTYDPGRSTGRMWLDPTEEGLSLDLRGTDLRNAALWRTHLEGALLTDANLEGAGLFGAYLTGANFERACLERAELGAADLRWTSFREAHLEGARLGGAHLEKAALEKAHLKKAFLWMAHLDGAWLGQAHLEGAILEKAHLEEAYLDGADLKGANLREAYLGRALLERANLEGANLEGAHLERVSLGLANLEGANFSAAHLEKAYLRGANLKGARNLTVEQLATVRTLYQAQLDPPLLEQIQRQYPQLLEEEQIQDLRTPFLEKSQK